METTATATAHLPQVLCCVCGVLIAPNAVNTCATCLAASADITRGISTEATLHQCRGCQRWHKEGGKWIACELESRELMALCLSHVSGLKTSAKANGSDKVRLVDAGWIWTEPHSMRLKVRLTVQRQVHGGTILQQSFTVIFIVRNQQCLECQAEFRQGTWKALVQVRQRVAHKRTFLYLEQLILKHDAHRGCLSIETFRDGMDFYFPDRSKAARFMSFLENVVPCKVKTSKKLVSTDDKSNIANFKHTNLVEICPLCKDDLLYLPVKLARQLGNIARLVLVKNVSNVIHLIDPLTGQTAALESDVFWRAPLRPLITAARARLSRYVVLGKEAVYLERNASKKTVKRKQATRLASLTLAREADLGQNDAQLEECSHVGYLLKAGDVCLGYDLQETQFVDDEAEQERANFPDVIVVRKLYGTAARGTDTAPLRPWRLRRLDVVDAETHRRKAATEDADAMDEEDFLQEVEADKDMRLNMNLYRQKILRKSRSTSMDTEDARSREGAMAGDNDEEESDSDDQKITLEELLDGLNLDERRDAEDEEGIEAVPVYGEGEKAHQDGIGYIDREEARGVREKEAAVSVANGALGDDFFGKL